jgi:hypothetical protein
MKMISKLPLVLFFLMFGVAAYLNYQDLERVDWNLKYPFMTEEEIEERKKEELIKKELEILKSLEKELYADPDGEDELPPGFENLPPVDTSKQIVLDNLQ